MGAESESSAATECCCSPPRCCLGYCRHVQQARGLSLVHSCREAHLYWVSNTYNQHARWTLPTPPPRNSSQRSCMPKQITCAGICTPACSSAGWHSSAVSCPASPSAAVIWSITPQGAPTHRFCIAQQEHTAEQSMGTAWMPWMMPCTRRVR